MSAELEITKELIAQLLVASGKTSGAFSEYIGVTTKALRMYLDGMYKPRKAYTVAKLKELADIYEVKPSTPTDATASVPNVPNHNAEFSPEILKAFQERSGLSSIEIAGLVGVATDTWYKWLKGKHCPSRAKSIKALRKILAEDRPKRKPGRPSNLTDAALVKGGKHRLSVTTAHEIAGEFHAEVQPQIKELVADAALSKVCKYWKSERLSQRGSIGTFFMLVKDTMTPQEIYEWCLGYSS